MRRAQMIAHAKAGLTDAHLPGRVLYLVPGKWPKSGRKPLDGKRGPKGKCIADFPGTDGVYCSFDAAAVLTYLEKQEP